MSVFKYIKKNLVTTIRKSPVIFGLYVICCVVSVFVVLFSHGVYQNYKSKLSSENDENLGPNGMPILDYSNISFGNIKKTIKYDYDNYESFYFYFGDGNSTIGQFRMVLNKLDEKTKSGFSGFYIKYNKESFNNKEYMIDVVLNKEAKDNIYSLASRLYYDETNCAYGLYDTFYNNIGSPTHGRYITQEEEINGSKVIVLPYESDKELVGKNISFLGQNYEVIGISSKFAPGEFSVPFSTLPDDITMNYITFLADKPMTTYAYRHLKAAFEEVYGDYVNFPELYTIDETEQTFYVSIMMISLVLSALSAIILAILYRYIIFTRRKTMSILRLNGCTRFKIRLMYLIEIMGTSIGIFVGCAYAYHKLILPKLTLVIERINEVYTFDTYLYVFAVFVSVLFVVINVMISLQLDKQPVNMFKRR